MAIIEAKGVSIRYITGDFKDIGLKEYPFSGNGAEKQRNKGYFALKSP